MTRHTTFALLTLCTFALTGCEGIEAVQLPPPPPPASHTVSFTGNIFDGATGMRVEDYTLQLVTNTDSFEAEIVEGLYQVGEISVWQDFTVIIDASGFRAFRSYNAQVGLPDEFDQSSDISEHSTQQSFHYDAYLFPEDLQAPEVTFSIDTGVLSMPPSGTIRLRPTSASVLANSPTETPVGVFGQQWFNDEDLQLGAITVPFSDGEITFAEGELVYGVTYAVNIYDVDGYQPFEGTYTAGIEADKLFFLDEEISAPLIALSNNISTCATATSPTDGMAALITIEFNQDIELGLDVWPGGAVEALDDGLFINSPDFDTDFIENILATDISSVVQERGSVLSIVGSTLTFYWDAPSGLTESDPDDPIDYVQWTNLGSIYLQKIDRPSSAQSLSSLIGQSSIFCNQ